LNILVTGGSGYIGSILVPQLCREHKVTVLDNLLYGQLTLAQCTRFAGFNFHKLDVRDWGALQPFVDKADLLIPLAGLVGAPLCDANPVDARLTNLEHPITLLKALSPDQRVIMPTTESAYGSNALVCTELTPINPISTYARDKAAVESILMQRDNAVSLRLGTVFGMSPRMRLDLLPNDFAWRAWKDHAIVLFEAHFKRTMVHVQDVARAFMHAMEIPAGIYNVGAFSASKLEICAAIGEHTPFTFVEEGNGTDPDQRNYVVSSDKLKASGFEFNYDLARGLMELFKGFPMLNNTRHGNV
jgi:nucleoside-diphosphate-sugar epimerase